MQGEFFGGIRPVTGMVGACRFISPEIRVEIEADALIGQTYATRADTRGT
jgi:hypothetical protein